MIRPTVARVDLGAITANYRTIAEFLVQRGEVAGPGISHPSPRIIAVVKANAYGHGAAQVALALEDAGAAMLACADIEEAIVLRQARRARTDPRLWRAERQRSRRHLRRTI